MYNQPQIRIVSSTLVSGKVSKFQLMQALMNRHNTIELNGNQFYLLSIEREDGSGTSFNLRVRDKTGMERKAYIRTID